MPIVAGLWLRFHELLVVCVFMLRVEAGGEAEIGKFYVAASIEEDVVGFDVSMHIS